MFEGEQISLILNYDTPIKTSLLNNSRSPYNLVTSEPDSPTTRLTRYF